MKTGKLLRIRRGVYADREGWENARPLERYAATALAIAISPRTYESVFCRESALAFHGLGFWNVPRSICIRAPSASAAGTWRPPDSSQRKEEEEKEEGESQGSKQQGSPSAGTKYPPFPEERRVRPLAWRDLGLVLGPEDADPRLAGTEVLELAGFRIRVEKLGLALAEAVPRMDPVEANVVLDAVMCGRRTGLRTSTTTSPRQWTRGQLESLAGACVSGAARERYLARVAAASPLSQSAGESASRAVIRELGFEEPELQHRVCDRQGRLVAITDFWWRSVQKAGEFDGLRKYTGNRSYSGRAAEDVVTEEKIREDDIRALGIGMVRWVAQDVRNPALLRTKLEHHGIPDA
ncbi:hypothetical protein [Citricoccus sp. GCM10030269]|uniref:hypothetical protein n=1 Tax=Citricoccus sp. GCM10030269 TaxID=3273388 RepID=UPI00361DB7A0